MWKKITGFSAEIDDFMQCNCRIAARDVGSCMREKKLSSHAVGRCGFWCGILRDFLKILLSPQISMNSQRILELLKPF